MVFDQLYKESLFQFVQDHLQEDPAHLLFKYYGSTDFDLKEAVQQIASRKKALNKLPSWAAQPRVIFPASLSMEQCSSELTARFKARFVKGKNLLDLTGGLGVDSLMMGEKFRELIYIESDEKLARIAAHNFPLLNKNLPKVLVVCTDSLDYLMQAEGIFDWIYVDPDRRGLYNEKLFNLGDCEPDVSANWDLLKEKANNIMIKASPMLDIKAVLRELPDLQQVLVVSVKNEVREILLIWKKKEVGGEVKISAFDLKVDQEQRFDFTFEEEEESKVIYGLPQGYLMEANTAIMKAGGFKSFALHYGLTKLHPNTHLYTSTRIPKEIPGRIFKVLQEVKLDKKELKRLFPNGIVNVLVRNHPLKAGDLKNKYGLKDGGKDFLIATMTMDGKGRVYWCERKNQDVKC